MKKDIRDMFESFTGEASDVYEVNCDGGISPDRVLLLTKEKIKEDNMKNIMKRKNVKKAVTLAAAVAVMLSATVFAAGRLLTPQEIAKEAGNYKLAEAFANNGIEFDIEPQISGDYKIELFGIMSGSNLTQFEPDVDADKERSYIVGAVSRTDGQKLGEDFEAPMISPLVSGYNPWQVNIFTLGGGSTQFLDEEDYTEYFVYECDNLEIFADHTIYIAAYEGIAPGSETFKMAEDGSINFNDSYKGIKALFTLPDNIFDKSEADPAAVEALLNSDGSDDGEEMQPKEDIPDEQTEVHSIYITEDGTVTED